jgi:hypothetical protein
VHAAFFHAVEFLVDAHEFLRRGGGQRTQRDAVEDREQSGVDADAEREGDHRGGGKTRAAAERPDGVADIVPEVRQHLGSSFVNGDV